MKKSKNIKPYDYTDDNMPCCVNDSTGIDGEISDELKQLIDERLAKIENGTMKFYTLDEIKRKFEIKKQAYLHKQQIDVKCTM
ncbi:MAG: addiction module protein [Bacteroidales bacterium]|nr:addiction module protein [Bacteroidales bacterium]